MIHTTPSRARFWRTIRRVTLSSAVLAVALVLTAHTSVLAFTPQERRDLLKRGISFVDEACAIPQAPEAANIEDNLTRDAHAQTIIGIAKTLNLGRRGALIGIMTALTETGLKNYANNGTFKRDNGSQPYLNTILGPYSQSLPHDAVGNDNDSVGLMQQRAVDGHWGPVDPKTNLADNIKWLMTPAYAAEAFFAMPKGKKDNKALVNVPGWQTMDPGKAAQTVQASAYPERYNDHRELAEKYITRLYDTTQPIDLPIPLATDAGEVPENEAEIGAGAHCLRLTTAGGRDAIIEFIKRYAWPTYCSQSGRDIRGADCGRNPLKAKKEYALAIQAAAKRMSEGKGDYLGDPCGYSIKNEIEDETYRVGIDCGGFVTRVMRDSGADPTYNSKLCNTACQRDYLRANSGTGKKYTRVSSRGQLQPGDIAVQNNGSTHHTFFYIGDALKADGFDSEAASASQCQRAPMSGGMDTFSKYEWYHLN